MSSQTKIEWCDSTANFWMGCNGISPACKNCYAEARMDKRLHRVEWGVGKARVRTSAKYWRDAVKMAREAFAECPKCGWRGEYRAAKLVDVEAISQCPICDGEHLHAARRRIFALSLGDWLDNEVQIEWLVDMLDVIRTTPESDWLLLTKRIGNWRPRLEAAAEATVGRQMALNQWITQWLFARIPPPNVWIGATVIDQPEADRDVPKLLRVPARVRFLSIEPMLGPIDLFWPESLWPNGPARCCDGRECGCMGRPIDPWLMHGIDWIIAGGESGSHARPMHRDWVRSMRDQCFAAGVPFLFKQWGEHAPNWLNDDAGDEIPGSMWMDRMGKKLAGRLLDGVEHNGFPS